MKTTNYLFVIFILLVGVVQCYSSALNRLQTGVLGASSMEVMRVPYLLTSRIPISPEAIGRVATFRRRFTRDADPRLFESLERSLHKLTVVGSTSHPDLRWGIILYSTKNKPIGSFYLERRYINRARNAGVLEGVPLEFTSELLDWAENSFGVN